MISNRGWQHEQMVEMEVEGRVVLAAQAASTA